jgi:ATP-binding cassette subfamily F protein 3
VPVLFILLYNPRHWGIPYIGNYDYYMEKRPEVEAAYLQTAANVQNAVFSGRPGAFPASLSSGSAASSVQDSESENKQSWQQQKEEQARIRKRKNDLKKTEDEIHQLEIRNDEIDTLLTQEDIFTNVQKLIELNNEKKEIENQLEELMEQWELLAAEE